MKTKNNSRWMKKFIFVLFCIALFLGFKINDKKQWFIFPIHSWLPFERWFSLTDFSVSKDINYYHLVDNLYTNGTNQCTTLFDGIVLEVEENKVHILSDEGIQIVYGELTHTIIQVDERVLKGQTIGTFDDSLTLNFSKDNQVMSYEEVMKY